MSLQPPLWLFLLTLGSRSGFWAIQEGLRIILPIYSHCIFLLHFSFNLTTWLALCRLLLDCICLCNSNIFNLVTKLFYCSHCILVIEYKIYCNNKTCYSSEENINFYELKFGILYNSWSIEKYFSQIDYLTYVFQTIFYYDSWKSYLIGVVLLVWRYFSVWIMMFILFALVLF